MSDTTLTIILAAAVNFVAAMMGLFISTRNGHKTTVVDHKVDTVDTKVDVVHTLVNSNLTAVKADLSLANERIEQLQTLVTKIQGIPVESKTVVLKADIPVYPPVKESKNPDSK